MKQVLSNFDGLAVLDSQPVLNGKELSCVLRKAVQQPQKKFDTGRVTISVN